MRSFPYLLVPALFAVLLPGFTASPQDGVAEVGDSVSYSFLEVPVNGMGISSLDDLKGKPVLLEFWGHR